MKKLSNQRSPRKEKIFGKKNALDRGAFNDALKCSQNVINQLEDRKNEIQKAQVDLEAFGEDFEEVKCLNKKLIEKMRKVEKEAEFKEGRIQKLDNEVINLFQESQKLREETEGEKKKSRELDYEVKYLKHNLDEEKNARNFIAKELSSHLKEKETKEQQMMKMEMLLSNKEGIVIDLKCKIECFEKEIIMKEQMIKNLDERMKQQHGLQANLQNTTTQQQCWLVVQENDELKRKVAHYKKCLSELKQQFNENEIEYCQHVKALEKKLKVSINNESFNANLQKKHHQQITPQLDSPSFEVFENRNISQANQEIHDTLKNLSESEKNRKGLLLDMQGKSMNRKTQIFQSKYDNSDLARKTRENRKPNRIAVESDERKALLTRLRKLEAENQKLAADSKEVFFDMKVCREKNTELVGKINNYQEEMNTINEAEYTRDVRREENTKLAERLRVYEEKLKIAKKEIASGEEWKQSCKEMELQNKQIKIQLESVESEKKTMEQTLISLQKDIEFYRKSSVMISNSSCCLDLKVGKQQLEKEVGQLQTHINVLEAKLKLSMNSDEELESVQQKLGAAKKDLDKAVSELEDCKIDLKDSKHENNMLKRKQQNGDERRPMEQPNVNVHVHLDPKQLLGHSAQYQQPAKQQQNKEQSSNDSEERIQGLLGEIQMLTNEKELLEERLRCSSDVVCGKEEGRSKELIEKELTNLKKEQASLLKENKKVNSQKLELESDMNDIQKRIEEYETCDSKMREEIDELRETLKESEEENKEKETSNKAEIFELRQKIQAQSNEDMDCLRKRIQDLALKKEKNESLIEKLREDKSDLQMTVEQLQRELGGLMKQLGDDKEDDRNAQKQRRNNETSAERQRDTVSPTKPRTSEKKIKNNTDDNASDSPQNVESRKPSKPLWLKSPSSKKTEDEQNESDDDFLDIRPNKKQSSVSQTKTQPEHSSSSDRKVGAKKPSQPLWLTSTPKKTDKDADRNDISDDDDFLGIRPKRKQPSDTQSNKKNTTAGDDVLNGLLTRLDTSNRRNVPKRNVNKQQQHQSDDEDDYCQITKETKTKTKENNPADAAEEFLQNFKPKVKKQENDSLDFLTLDDIKTPPVKRKPISVQPRGPKPIRNAEFLIP